MKLVSIQNIEIVKVQQVVMASVNEVAPFQRIVPVYQAANANEALPSITQVKELFGVTNIWNSKIYWFLFQNADYLLTNSTNKSIHTFLSYSNKPNLAFSNHSLK